jgi:hypothetical protein
VQFGFARAPANKVKQAFPSHSGTWPNAGNRNHFVLMLSPTGPD